MFGILKRLKRKDVLRSPTKDTGRGLWIFHHLGLGDHFICNGLVRHFCSQNSRVYLLCYKSNSKSVAFMYRDVSNLEVVPVSSDKKALLTAKKRGEDAIILGTVHNKEYPAYMHWADVFYHQAGLDSEIRYTGFHVQRDFECENKLKARLCGKNENYIFVHDDKKRGYEIDGKYLRNRDVVRPQHGLTKNIFDYLKIIEGAKEVHCIDSSFLCLIDNFFFNSYQNRHFYLHRYARDTLPPKVGCFWHALSG